MLEVVFAGCIILLWEHFASSCTAPPTPTPPQPPASLPVSHSALTPSAAAYTKKKGTNHAYSPGIDSQSARPHWKADAHTHVYARTHTGKLERQWQHDSVDPSPCFPCPLPELVLALELPLAAPGGEIQAGRHPQWRCETVSLFPQPAVSCHAAPLNSSWQRRPRDPTVGSIRLDCVKLMLRRDYWGKTVLIQKSNKHQLLRNAGGNWFDENSVKRLSRVRIHGSKIRYRRNGVRKCGISTWSKIE